MIPKHFLSQMKQLFSTVNKKQMQQFDTIRNWWHPASQMAVLYQYNFQRIQFLRDILKKQQSRSYDLRFPLKDFKIIDVGCGAGFLSQSMTRLGGNVVGLDPNNTSFTLATQHKDSKDSLINLKYENCSIKQYLQKCPQQRGKQDLVASMDVIQHVDNPKMFISQLVSALMPGGLIFLSTISKTFYSFLTHILVAQYLTGLVPRGTHNFEKFSTPQRLCKMLQDADVQILALRQLNYNLKGEFQRKQGGENYMVIGRKLSSNKQVNYTKQ